MYINIAPEISRYSIFVAGYVLEIGSSGEKVRQIQEQLNVIAERILRLPKITADGIYGSKRRNRSENFRKCFNCRKRGKSTTVHGIKYPKFMSAYPESQELT